MSLGAYLTSQTLHPFNATHEASRWDADTFVPTCADCGMERDHRSHPQRESIPLSNAHMALGQVITARQHLRAAAEMLGGQRTAGEAGSTAVQIASNLYQRAHSLESIEACLQQAMEHRLEPLD